MTGNPVDRPPADAPTGAGKARGQKMRLDELVVLRGLADTRSRAERLIMAGQVSVDGSIADKPGKPTPIAAEVALRQGLRYVSRGGLKLEAALDAFGLDPTGWACADIGASTGGFTDCLLQRGARRIYAIDVGYGQLAWQLRQDPRVVSIERANIRHLEALPEPVALATVDVSFIGLGLVLPRVAGLLAPGGHIVALIKPQFEVGKGQVGKGGVVRDPQLHRAVLHARLTGAIEIGLAPGGLIRSPIKGPAGNVEFLVWLKTGAPPPTPEAMARWINACTLPEGPERPDSTPPAEDAGG
jgi:23S rRNA (cytidine1920-2'-O)/16S rRNA (cytidine1409-2'-O)-methyltransferase